MPGRSASTGTLLRGLELLRLLNEAHPLQVRELHEATGLPKPTISRLLSTLAEAGYVQWEGRLGYRPATKLAVLSAGLSSQSWIQDVAAPAIDRLSQLIRWPSDFAVFEGRGMALRYSTRATAPIAVTEAINRSDITMMDSDLGRAFLAFAADEQRTRILKAIAHGDRCFDGSSLAMRQANTLWAQVRRDGFATRGQAFSFAQASAVAVAVVVEGQSVGALNVICRRRFVRPDDVPKRYGAALRQTAAEISQALYWDGPVLRTQPRLPATLTRTRVRA